MGDECRDNNSRSLREVTEEMRQIGNELGICPDIHHEDYIHEFMARHPDPEYVENATRWYLRGGENSARLLKELIQTDTEIDPESPFTMLEFASGYGCVTRHFKNVLPKAKVVSCDIHPQALQFIFERLGIEASPSVLDPADFRLDKTFDIVFALSFFSHMPHRSFGPWLVALFRHVREGGSLIFTTHGLVTLRQPWNDGVELNSDGFWFKPVSEQFDLDTENYGTAISSPAYVTRLIHRLLGGSLALHDQGHWWGHQDVYVVQKPRRTEPTSPAE